MEEAEVVKREHYSFKFGVKVDGQEIVDVPPLRNPLDFLMCCALIRSADREWRRQFKTNRAHSHLIAMMRRRESSRIPFRYVFQAALISIALENLAIAEVLGFARREGPNHIHTDNERLQAAYHHWKTQVLDVALSSEYCGNDQRLMTLRRWFDKLEIAVLLWNERDCTSGLSPHEFLLRTVWKLVKQKSPNVDDSLRDQVELDELYSLAAEVEIDDRPTALYMDLEDGSCHLDYHELARRLCDARGWARDKNSALVTKSLTAPIDEGKNEAATHESNIASGVEDPSYQLTLADARDALDKARSDLDEYAQAEMEWQLQRETEPARTRKQVAQALGVSERQMRRRRDEVKQLIVNLRRELHGRF